MAGKKGRRLDYHAYKGLTVPENVQSLKDLQLAPKQLIFLERFVLNNFILGKSLKEAKVCWMTYYDWRENYPHFAKAIEVCRYRFVDVIEGKFAELVEDKNPAAVMFGLKTLGRDRGYAEKQEINHTGVNEISVVFDKTEKIIDGEVVDE